MGDCNTTLFGLPSVNLKVVWQLTVNTSLFSLQNLSSQGCSKNSLFSSSPVKLQWTVNCPKDFCHFSITKLIPNLPNPYNFFFIFYAIKVTLPLPNRLADPAPALVFQACLTEFLPVILLTKI